MDLPEDIIFDVFHRLPAASVGRCKCVCKAWHNIIGTSFFIKTHLAYQKASSNKYILHENYPLVTLIINSEEYSSFDITEHSKQYCRPDDFKSNSSGLHIYGICNGLICMSELDYETGDIIILWNPTCKKIKKLPQLDISNIINDAYDFSPSMSFGYYNEDYKVIAIVPIDNTYIVCVYSLSTNSWNIIHPNISFDDDADHELIHDKTKFVDGITYVMSSYHLICFDLTDETFRLIEPPVEDFGLGSSKMEVYGETIAIFYSKHSSRFLTMWILRDKSSSTSPSWERKFSIKVKEAGCQIRPVGFLNNGNYVISTIDGKGVTIKFFLCHFEFSKLIRIRDLDPELLSLLRDCSDPYDRLKHGHIHSNYVESLLLLLDEDSHYPYPTYNGYLHDDDDPKLLSDLLSDCSDPDDQLCGESFSTR